MNSITIEMVLDKETKNTFVYKCDDTAPINSLYIKKTGVSGDAPKGIKVTVEQV